MNISHITGLGSTWLITSENRFDEFRDSIEEDLEQFSLSFKVFPTDPSIMDEPDQLRDISRREGVKCCITKRRINLDPEEEPHLLIDLLSFSNPKSLPNIKDEILEFAAKTLQSPSPRSPTSPRPHSPVNSPLRPER